MNFLEHKQYVMGIRPEDVQVCPNGDRQGVLIDKSFLGAFTLLVLDNDGKQVTVQLPNQSAEQCKLGDRISFNFPKDLVTIFSQE